MSYTEIFTVPDYYPSFSCKCGDCRSTCCNGWGISLSMQEYFKMLSLPVSEKLRRKLDVAFHLADERTPEHYALATPRYDGHCRLQDDDGYCMLQRECGEDAISAVCRYYPRAPKLSPLHECCTSASCERTIELLFASDEPLSFVEKELTFCLDKPEPSDFPIEKYAELRKIAFSLIENRSMPLADRLYLLGCLLYHRDGSTVTDSVIPSAASVNDTADALALMEDFAHILAKSSDSLNEWLPKSLPDTKRLYTLFSDLDIKCEKLIVNHLFYEGFPNSMPSAAHPLDGEFMALAAMHGFIKYLAAGYMADKTSLEDFIDVLAESFRIIEHSRFDECAVTYLSRHGYITPEQLYPILCL